MDLKQKILNRLAKSCFADNWEGFKETHWDDNMPEVVERGVDFALEEVGKEIGTLEKEYYIPGNFIEWQDKKFGKLALPNASRFRQGIYFGLQELKKRLSLARPKAESEKK